MRSMIAPLVAHRQLEAACVAMWVLGQRNVVNIDINRSVQRYMKHFDIREDQHDRLVRLFGRVVEDLKDAGLDVEKCKDCPGVDKAA